MLFNFLMHRPSYEDFFKICLPVHFHDFRQEHAQKNHLNWMNSFLLRGQSKSKGFCRPEGIHFIFVKLEVYVLILGGVHNPKNSWIPHHFDHISIKIGS